MSKLFGGTFKAFWRNSPDGPAAIVAIWLAVSVCKVVQLSYNQLTITGLSFFHIYFNVSLLIKKLNWHIQLKYKHLI